VNSTSHRPSLQFGVIPTSSLRVVEFVVARLAALYSAARNFLLTDS
jgi:hypothetical protein